MRASERITLDKCLTFGSHSGMTARQILATNPGYLAWWRDSSLRAGRELHDILDSETNSQLNHAIGDGLIFMDEIYRAMDFYSKPFTNEQEYADWGVF